MKKLTKAQTDAILESMKAQLEYSFKQHDETLKKCAAEYAGRLDLQQTFWTTVNQQAAQWVQCIGTLDGMVNAELIDEADEERFRSMCEGLMSTYYGDYLRK